MEFRVKTTSTQNWSSDDQFWVTRGLGAVVFAFILYTFPFIPPNTASAAVLGGAGITQPVNNLGLVGYWPFEDMSGGMTPDMSGKGYNGTLQGNASSTPGKVGKGAIFDGTGDYIDVGDVTALNNATKFTISGWAKQTTLNEARFFYGKYTGGRLMMETWTDGRIYMEIGGTFRYLPSYANYVRAGEWFHWAEVFDGTQGTDDGRLKLYINGVQMTLTGSITTVTPNNSGVTFRIGRSDYDSSMTWKGSMDEFRIYDRPLSAAEVKALYKNQSARVGTANTTTVNNGLMGYWTFNGPDVADVIYDRSGQGNNASVIGGAATSSMKTPGKLGQALRFTGASTRAQSLSNVGITGDAAFSIAGWFYFRSGSSAGVLGWGNIGAGLGATGFYFGLRGTNVISAEFAGNNPAYVNSPVSLNQWHHIVYTKTPGAINTTSRFYVDGVDLGPMNAGSSAGTPSIQNSIMRIGQWGDSTYALVTMDDLRIYNRALSATEARALYSMGAGNSAGSSAAAGQTNGLIGHWTMDGSKINWSTNQMADSSGQGNAGQLINLSTTTSPVAGKIGQALRFTGNATTYINLGSHAVSQIAAAPISISAWVKPNNDTDYRRIISREVHFFFGTQNRELIFGIGSGGGWNSLTTFGADATLTNGLWYHVAVVYDGSSARGFVNGADVGTVTATLGSNSNNLLIGSHGSLQAWNGVIDDVRIYNRALSAAEVRALYNATK